MCGGLITLTWGIRPWLRCGWGQEGDGLERERRPSWGHAAKLRPENNEQSLGSRKVVRGPGGGSCRGPGLRAQCV